MIERGTIPAGEESVCSTGPVAGAELSFVAGHEPSSSSGAGSNCNVDGS
jgi:hypothetical protein